MAVHTHTPMILPQLCHCSLTGIPKKLHKGMIVIPCLQESTELQQENAKLKERCNLLEGEVRALRQDMTALQRHLHMPVTLSALSFDDSTPLPTNNKRTKTQVCLANHPVGLALMFLHTQWLFRFNFGFRAWTTSQQQHHYSGPCQGTVSLSTRRTCIHSAQQSVCV